MEIVVILRIGDSNFLERSLATRGTEQQDCVERFWEKVRMSFASDSRNLRLPRTEMVVRRENVEVIFLGSKDPKCSLKISVSDGVIAE